MSLSGRPKVLISIRINSLEGIGDGEIWANINVEMGGYIHQRDMIKTERKIGCPITFDTKLCVEYFFEEKQIIIVEILEYKSSPEKDVLIGEVDCSIGRVIHSGGIFTKTLNFSVEGRKLPNQTSIEVTIFVEEDLTAKENLELKIKGMGLARTEIFGKTDPYLTIFRCNSRGRYIQCYRTEVLRNTQNPDWPTLTVSQERLCNNDWNSELCLRVYCGDGTLSETEEVDIRCDQIVGEVTVTAGELVNMTINDEKKFELINPKKKRKKKSYLNSGMIVVRAQKSKSEPTFLDFMFQGMELNFIVAIDLTLSNGDPKLPSSLHFMDSTRSNEYSVAIQAVLEILQEYDNDELFPAFGFGARVPPDYKICHEYPLNGDFNNPYCQGAEGVIEAYQRTLQEVTLAGPTCFAPVIRHISRLAKASESGKHYFVLLILTDGTVDDWVETKKAVVETSYLPVSIIVVGVGGGKFSDMETLDQDFGLLTVSHEKACRDNVQFVKMRRYLRAAADGSQNIRWSKVALGKDVLAELPYQVVEYMHRREELNNYLNNLPTQRSTSVFSSCLRQGTSSDSHESLFQRTSVNNSTKKILPGQRILSQQAKQKLLKNSKQFSVDSSLFAKELCERRTTPPFQRKSNF